MAWGRVKEGLEKQVSRKERVNRLLLMYHLSR